MLGKYLNTFFENLKYVKGGVGEIVSPIKQFVFDVIDSPIFKILYFIPFAILKFITITIDWYYENFMNNPLMLQSSANRVIFVYLIPIAVILILFRVLAAKNGIGFRLLLASPFIFAFFPIFAIWGVCTLVKKVNTATEDSILKKKDKLLENPPYEIEIIKNEDRKKKVGLEK